MAVVMVVVVIVNSMRVSDGYDGTWSLGLAEQGSAGSE
jgi:hypothetical protein